MNVRAILNKVQSGKLSTDEAEQKIQQQVNELLNKQRHNCWDAYVAHKGGVSREELMSDAILLAKQPAI